MVSINALQRTFRIKFGESCGTCFTIDIDNKQYIVTARHVVEGITDNDIIEIFHSNQWHPHPIKIVGVSRNEVDIAVISVNFQLSPSHSLPAKNSEMFISQDVYFLGFPYNLFTDAGEMNQNFPIAFVKKAIVSSFTFTPETKCLFLDGHNNPGFSGGPVVFANRGSDDLKVAAVISGYRFQPEPIYSGEQQTSLVV